MLFTRCPGCQTTFRITADTLRVANGAVRCGSCATVFSAFSGLQQEALEEDLQADDEFLSPTMQMQELAGIEELEGPEVDDAPIAQADPEAETELEAAEPEPALDRADEERPDLDVQVDAEDGDPDVAAVGSQAQAEEEPAQDSAQLDSPVALEDAPALQALTPEQGPEQQPEGADLAASRESPDGLDFDAPADDWAQFMSEIEQSTQTRARAEDEAGSGDRESGEAESEPDSVELWDVGDPAASASWTEIEESTGEDADYERVAVGELEAAPDIDAPVGDAQIEAEVSELLDAVPDISPEQVDATLSADPVPALVRALDVGAPSRTAGDKRSHIWAVGSTAMAFALMFQAVHHFREPLAGQSLVGPLVQNTYGFFGAELVPEWDLEQYEILNWVATEAGPGNLRITAQIRNNGPRTQPYPYIHLELKDRWEAVVGSRVFEPFEYLGPDVDSTVAMAAGLTVPADLAVVDPGEDAYGFELDVCIPRSGGAGQLSCASQRVFE